MPSITNNRFKNFKQGNKKQYGLKHRVTGTIHSAMGILSLPPSNHKMKKGIVYKEMLLFLS